MILAIDMGNTNIVLGGIDEKETYFIERVFTPWIICGILSTESISLILLRRDGQASCGTYFLSQTWIC